MPHHTGNKSAKWAEVDKLASAQKLQEASDLVAKIREEATRAGHDDDQTRALVREVQLRIALGGYETAVRFLKEQKWPEDAPCRLVLELYYAHTLVNYLNAYSWEINQREKVASKGPIDLKAWTRGEIFAEALAAYDAIWAQRDELAQLRIDTLSEYVSPNSYPREVRGTIRDALSYLAVELLAHNSYWSPAEHNELFRLDFDKLLAGRASDDQKVKLADTTLHPIARALHVLDDLESWHRGANRKEAAVEARLERLARLRQAFSDKKRRSKLLAHAESLRDQNKSLNWWAMGEGFIAELYRDDVGDLVKAHALARAAEAQYKTGPGVARCQSIAIAIEQPDFQLVTMANDGAQKRSITVSHKNIARIYVRAYAFDLEDRISKSENYSLLSDHLEVSRVLKSEKPIKSFTVELPATPDYKMHRTYATPPLPGPGAYYLIASAREDFAESKNRIKAAPFIISDLVILVHPGEGTATTDATVVSGETGKPMSGVEVRFYKYDYQKKHHAIATSTTDANGEAHLKAPTGQYGFLYAKKGRDAVLDLQGVSSGYTSSERSTAASLIYTDRGIYRPGQKVLWKVVAYKGTQSQAKYEVAPQVTLDVKLHDANNEEVATHKVTTGDFGSAAGEFVVPAGRLLGAWSIRASQGNSTYHGHTSFRVEEYKRPTFEVSFLEAKEALRLNQPATMRGEAKYYFGLPVTAGKVKWRVERTPVFPWWWWCWYRWGGGGDTSAQKIAEGTATLDGEGHFDVKFTPEVEESDDKSISYSYAITADLTDEGGETRTASRSFRLGFTSVETSLSLDTAFVRAGHAAKLTARRTNLDGTPRAGAGTWRLVAIAQPEKAVVPSELAVPTPLAEKQKPLRTPGDLLRPRHEPGYAANDEIARMPDGAELAHGKLAHDATGAATIDLGQLKAGLYRVRYETVDDFGAKFTTWHDFLVAGPQTPFKLPFQFLVESGSVPVGGTARLFIASGLPNQTLFLDRYRDGKRIERRRLDGSAPNVIEVPVTEKDRGGFGFSVSMVRDHQALTHSGSVMVPWDNKQLAVSFKTFRDKMTPGGKETWRVEVKAPNGKALAARTAELLTYMYDRSLDFFGGHSVPSPLSLYPWRASAGSLRAALSGAHFNHLHESDFVHSGPGTGLVPDRLISIDRYGIGGMGTRGYGYGGGGLRHRTALAPPAPPKSMPAREMAKREEADADDEAAPMGKMGAAVDRAAANAQSATTENKPPEGKSAADVPLRSNFAETAFFIPQLLLGGDGTAAFEFTVPDSVTSWNVWVHAITKDLSAGSKHLEARSVKELMVRPYLPRFFRENDQASVKVVVNNAGAAPMRGKLHFDIVDPETQKSVASLFGLNQSDQEFSVEPGKGTNLTFALSAPKKVGTYAFKVSATAGSFGDGELRPLPVLPSRFHLVQSRFVTLRDKSSRTMTFDDLKKDDDPTRVNDQLVVTIEGQLFYTVLKALPYLIDYPYECVEQTLNRFVSTGIVSSLYSQFPAVAKMAAEFSKRKTIVEGFDAPDANRKMTLEESPWLVESKGGDVPNERLINALDPKIAAAQRESALMKLRKTQTSNGAFPWFPGGPPSPYMTLYLMHGLARAVEFKVDVPKDMTVRAWAYLASEFRREWLGMMRREVGWEIITFLNFVASSYPDASYTGSAFTDAERKEMLDFSFRHWKQHSPLLKGMLTLTLKRAGRLDDAKKVFASVMDSAKTKEDQGTFWAPEDRSWLWYNDTIETHAFALRVLGEIEPQHNKRDGLVLWLLLNKKLNQWKSTRATAEVIYSLAHYLKAESSLGVREEIHVAIGDADKRTVVMEPEHYSPKTQFVIPGPEVNSQKATVTVDKETKGFAFASSTWHFSTEKLPSEDRGDFFNVSRKYFRRVLKDKQWTLEPIAEGAKLEVGDQLEVQVSLRTKHAAEYVHLRDPRGAGFEPENPVSRWKWDLGIAWYEETRDSGANFFFEQLPVGEYTFKYRVRANMAGTFRVGPATVQSMYAPEFNAYSTGATLTIK